MLAPMNTLVPRISNGSLSAVTIAAATRSYFRAPPGAPADVFAAEADQHPVFELLPFRRPDAA